MIIGYLLFGVLGAVLSAVLALLSGFGLWAVFGFYLLGGHLSMMAAVCISLRQRPRRQSALIDVKA